MISRVIRTVIFWLASTMNLQAGLVTARSTPVQVARGVQGSGFRVQGLGFRA